MVKPEKDYIKLDERKHIEKLMLDIKEASA